MYDPIYQAAQAADLPVLFHSVATIHPNFPHNTHGFETEMGQHTVGHAFSIIANLVDVVTAGVPVRFPSLRIAFTEAGYHGLWIMQGAGTGARVGVVG